MIVYCLQNETEYSMRRISFKFKEGNITFFPGKATRIFYRKWEYSISTSKKSTHRQEMAKEVHPSVVTNFISFLHYFVHLTLVGEKYRKKIT